jgi:hypothetical protein
MSNDIANPNSAALAAFGNLRLGVSQARASMPASVGGTPYLRLLRDGSWALGQQDTQIAIGTEAIINPLSIQHGYSCWTNRGPKEGKNELLGDEMWKITQPKPPAHTLPEQIDPRTQARCVWKDQMSFELKFLDGSEKNQQALFKSTSVGGMRLMTEVLEALENRLGEGTTYVFPIVRIGVDSYQHASYGKTYVPQMEIVGWADMDGDEEDNVTTTKVAPAPEPVVVEPDAAEAPTGRRRRV